jgi:ATP-dependent Lon protease
MPKRRFDEAAASLFTPEECSYIHSLGANQQRDLTRAMMHATTGSRRSVPRRIRVLQAQIPDSVKSTILSSLSTCRSGDKLEAWVDALLEIPFGRVSRPPVIDNVAAWLRSCRAMMDLHLYGQTKAKDEVTRMLLQYHTNPLAPLAPIAVVGLPGIGKTSFCQRVLSSVLNRPFATIALGGVSDSHYLTGHSITYEGSVPGMIATVLRSARKMDPLIYFDELDKLSKIRGDDVTNVLMHLTDKETNTKFRDKYFSTVPLDVSQCVFAFSFNDASLVSPVLLDRLNVIPFEPPTASDKVHIARNFLLPRVLCTCGITATSLTFDDVSLSHLIKRFTDEPGVRSLERCLHRLVSSLHLAVVDGSIAFPIDVTRSVIDAVLDAPVVQRPMLALTMYT